MWRTLLLTGPAKVIDIWIQLYTAVLIVSSLATVGMLVIVLLLAAMGIRWGW